MEAVAAGIRWLHPRWGQMLCFWIGGLFLAGEVLDTTPENTSRNLMVGGVLVAIGLALKGLAVLKAAMVRGS